jgi:MFS family permease
MRRSLSGNIELYRWFHFASSFYGWLPVFFLYFNQYVSLGQTIQLGAIYYFAVCVFEVPSGYLSDKVGRRLTLILSSLSFIVSYTLFILASDFGGLALGQIFLALGIAMMSGTDTAFLYDSLVSLNREKEYAELEAQAQKFGFIAAMVTALLGGLLGLVNLQWAYWLSMLGAGLMLWIAINFKEPELCNASGSESMWSTIGNCFRSMRNKVLAWLFGVMILMYGIEHVTYEFYQPYIRLLDLSWFEGDEASLVSALVISASMFGGMVGATYSVRLLDKCGIKPLLFVALGFQLIILSGLSVVLSGAALSLVVFRNFPMAMISAPVNSVIAPRIGSHIRATYLSIQSLASRLALSGLLLALASSNNLNDALEWDDLSQVLGQALVVFIVATTLVVLLAPKSKEFE